MKKLMIVGASVLQLPAIQKAKEMGLKVAAADFNPNAVGRQFADKFYEVSTIDEQGVYEAAKDFEADGIMTLATDMPMRSVAYTAEKLNLVGISYQTAVNATDKGEMIKAFEQGDVPHPWFYILNSVDELDAVKDKIKYPCICKPVDNAGSRGVALIKSPEDLQKSVQYSSDHGRNGTVILEEYLQGSEVSVEVMAYHGEIHILQVTDKLTTGAPHFVEMGHSQPSQLGEFNVQAIREVAAKAVKAVGIENGPAHVEIMLTPNGPKMIELGARMGGDYITSHLVPLSTGIDMVKATIDISLGIEPDLDAKFDKGSAVRFFPEQKGILKEIHGTDQAKQIDGIKEVILTKTCGELLGSIDSSADRIGSVIAQSVDAKAAVDCCSKAIEKIEIEVEEKA